MKFSARWIYDHSPIAAQNLMCTMAGAVRNWQRYDRGFSERLSYYRNTLSWDLKTAEAHQLDQLRKLYAHCLDKVPYYRAQNLEAVLPRDFSSLRDWGRLPSLSKDQVRTAGVELISAGESADSLIKSQSGGSTGMPLRCYHDAESLKKVYAMFWVSHRPGVGREDKYATFQGMELIPKSQVGGPFWRMNRAMHQRLYSIYHLSESTIASYIADLDKFEPVYLAGYANSLYLLAQLADESKITPRHAPKAVFSTSEQLLPHQRATIERVFRTRVWDGYSQDETCGSISQYECGYYHYDRAYGYMEFEHREDLGQGRRLAEIVCTGFFNHAWPLIRYRPGDLVEYEEANQCPKCGRAGPIIHAIRGRTGDFLVLPSGRRFPHISLVVKDLRGVRQVQLVQKAVDQVTIRYVPSEGFSRSVDVPFMVEKFSAAVGEPLRWQTEELSEIPRTAAGKFKSIVSELSKT